MKRAAQWVLISVPLVLGVFAGLIVTLLLLWYAAFMQGYMLVREYAKYS